MSGIAEHVVSRRLGHVEMQTTQNLYGWVSEEAAQRAVAQWRQLTAGWRTEHRAPEKIIAVLNPPELTEHPDEAVRGPATTARAANHPATDHS
jgi:hypothetical protein